MCFFPLHSCSSFSILLLSIFFSLSLLFAVRFERKSTVKTAKCSLNNFFSSVARDDEFIHFPMFFFSFVDFHLMCCIIVLVCQKMTRKSSHNSFWGDCHCGLGNYFDFRKIARPKHCAPAHFCLPKTEILFFCMQFWLTFICQDERYELPHYNQFHRFSTHQHGLVCAASQHARHYRYRFKIYGIRKGHLVSLYPFCLQLMI